MKLFPVTLALLAILTVSAGCQQQEKSTDNFESIRLQVCQGKYEQAIPALEAYRGKHESRAGLFLGKAWLGIGDYGKAREAFEITVKKFPGTLEDHKARYKLAWLSWVEGDAAQAKQQFEALANRPDGPLAAEAAAFAKAL